VASGGTFQPASIDTLFDLMWFKLARYVVACVVVWGPSFGSARGEATSVEVSPVVVARAAGDTSDNPAQASSPLPVRPIATTLKIQRYAQRIIRRYDTNGDGRLQADEWHGMHGDPASIDRNADGVITLEEFSQHVARFARSAPRLTPRVEPVAVAGNTQAAPGDVPTSAGGPSSPGKRARRFFVSPARLPQGLPEWFAAADRNGDSQLDLAEFTTARQTESGSFTRLDLDGDGLITPRELITAEQRGKSDTNEKSPPPKSAPE